MIRRTVRSSELLATLTRTAAIAFVSLLATACDRGPTLPQWSLYEELRIGSRVEPDRALSEVGDVAVSDDGRVFVAQPDQSTIRVFDPSGETLGYIGRAGPGTGQFTRLYAIGLLEDTLYAIDLSQRRISFFSIDGELLGEAPGTVRGVGPPFLPGPPFALFPDGTGAAGTAIPQTAPPEALLRVPQLRVDREGNVVDTATWISYEHTAARVDYEGRALGVGSPLSDDVFAMFSADGTRVASIDRTAAQGPDDASFGVTVTGSSGDTVYSRRYEYTPEPMVQAVVNQAVLPLGQRYESIFPSFDAAEAFLRENMFLPDYFTPVSNALFSDDGSLWLQRETIPAQDETWMVLDPAGEPVADVTVPEDLRVMLIKGDELWGVLPVGPFVVKYRVVRE